MNGTGREKGRLHHLNLHAQHPPSAQQQVPETVLKASFHPD